MHECLGYGFLKACVKLIHTTEPSSLHTATGFSFCLLTLAPPTFLYVYSRSLSRSYLLSSECKEWPSSAAATQSRRGWRRKRSYNAALVAGGGGGGAGNINNNPPPPMNHQQHHNGGAGANNNNNNNNTVSHTRFTSSIITHIYHWFSWWTYGSYNTTSTTCSIPYMHIHLLHLYWPVHLLPILILYLTDLFPLSLLSSIKPFYLRRSIHLLLLVCAVCAAFKGVDVNAK